MQSQRAPTGSWVSIGPRPTTAGNFVSGRVISAAIDPRDSNVVYAGAATGGVWKTTDAGANWTPLTDDQPALASGSIALDPQNPDIVYVGTGELSFSGDSYHGAGILKSTDGGASWRNIPGPFAQVIEVRRGTAAIGAVAVFPQSTNIVLAGAYFRGVDYEPFSGIYRSVDGGETWSQTLSGAAAIRIFFDPTGTIAYASLGYYLGSPANGVYASYDAGDTWIPINGTVPFQVPNGISVGRLELALDPNDTTGQTLYAAAASPNTSAPLLGIYKTVDGGQNWNRISTFSLCDGQCWYDLALVVHPTNPDVLIAGGSVPAVFASLNGGLSWSSVSSRGGQSIHVDLHTLTFSADAVPRLYVGSDGGLWRNDNILDATVPHVNLNQTLALTQFYPGHSIHPTNPGFGFAGAQDNQVQRYTGSLVWQSVACGDGGQTAIDYQSPNIVYATCQNIDIQRSMSSGASGTFSAARTGINLSDRVQFIPPMIIDPIDPQRLYFGTYRLYRTTNRAAQWSAISGDLSGGTGSRDALTAIAVAPTNPDVLYTGAFTGRVNVTDNALSDPPTFTDITAGLPLRPVTALAVDNSDPSIAYVTIAGYSGIAGNEQGHVFQWNNGTWTDISFDLPNIPVNDIVVDPARPGAIYIGTDVGVYSLQASGQWIPLGVGLPVVPVVGLKLHASGILRVVTHGRSAWDLDLSQL
jgi:photosystem II stability/assembly factor-like uncharacterized protein